MTLGSPAAISPSRVTSSLGTHRGDNRKGPRCPSASSCRGRRGGRPRSGARPSPWPLGAAFKTLLEWPGPLAASLTSGALSRGVTGQGQLAASLGARGGQVWDTLQTTLLLKGKIRDEPVKTESEVPRGPVRWPECPVAHSRQGPGAGGGWEDDSGSQSVRRDLTGAGHPSLGPHILRLRCWPGLGHGVWEQARPSLPFRSSRCHGGGRCQTHWCSWAMPRGGHPLEGQGDGRGHGQGDRSWPLLLPGP